MDFAVLDDSMVNENGIYVYSHALIISEELPEVLIFHGNNEEIYQHESEIKEFLEQKLYIGYQLYACNHYEQHYPTIWEELVSFSANGTIPRNVRKLFGEAHNTAKTAAKQKLQILLERT